MAQPCVEHRLGEVRWRPARVPDDEGRHQPASVRGQTRRRGPEVTPHGVRRPEYHPGPPDDGRLAFGSGQGDDVVARIRDGQAHDRLDLLVPAPLCPGPVPGDQDRRAHLGDPSAALHLPDVHPNHDEGVARRFLVRGCCVCGACLQRSADDDRLRGDHPAHGGHGACLRELGQWADGPYRPVARHREQGQSEHGQGQREQPPAG